MGYSLETKRQSLTQYYDLLERAKSAGNKSDIKTINVYISELERQIEDEEEGYSSEVANFTRNAVKGAMDISPVGIVGQALFGEFDDDSWAKISSVGGVFGSYDEAKAKIARQRELGKDNRYINAAGTLLGTLPQAALNATMVGRGATLMGTFARQGGLAMAETAPYAYRSLDASKKYAENQNLIEGFDTDMQFSDYLDEFAVLVGAGVIGGGLGAVTLGKAKDWGTTPSSKPFVATEQGARTQVDDIADTELDAVSKAAQEAEPAINAAFEQAREMRRVFEEARTETPKAANPASPPDTNAMRAFGSDPLTPQPKPQPEPRYQKPATHYDLERHLDEIQMLESRYKLEEIKAGNRPSAEAASLRKQVQEAKDNFAKVAGDQGPHRMSLLDDKPWVNRKTEEQLRAQQKDWRDASTAGEVTDAVTNGFKNFWKDKIFGLDNRLMWDVSKELGGRFQVANESTVRQLTREIEEFVRPADRVFRLNIEDPHLQALLLDFANDAVGVRSPIKMADVKSYITQRLSAKEADAFENYYYWSKKNSVDTMAAFTGRPNDDFLTNQYLHTRLTPAAKERKGIEIRDLDDLEIMTDPGTRQRDRNFYFRPTNKLRGGPPTPSDYLPVLQSDLTRIMNNRMAINMSERMGMRKFGEGERVNPETWFASLEKTFRDRGLHAEGAQYATKRIKDHMVGTTRSPELWIQSLNSFSYMKTLAGPKSAMLNYHDPAMAVVNFEVPFTEMIPSLRRAWRNEAGADVRASGIDQKIGEFVQDHINSVTRMEGNKQFGQRWWADNTREMTDKFMKWSFFDYSDMVNKNATLNIVLEQMVRDAKSGAFSQKWGFYLNPTDMNQLIGALKKNGAKFSNYKGRDYTLVEDVAFAGLGQQQLISASGRSSAWARNPNLRPLWALRGFASKQQGILMWKVVDNFRNGNTKEAYKYLGMYATVVGGSFGILNESRQWLFGDGNFDLTGVFMGMADQMLSTASVNTVGLNDYQWGRINEVGIAQAFIESLMPVAIDAPYETGKDIVATLQGEQGPLYPIARFPLVKQPIAFSQNMVENVGQTVDNLTFEQVDVRPYIKDPQEEVLKRVGMLKDLGDK